MSYSILSSIKAKLPVPILVAAFLASTGIAPSNAQDGKERYCDEYTEQAADAASRNKRDRCGFEGPRWIANSDLHRFWCMAVPLDQSRRESAERRVELQRCADRSSDRRDDRPSDRRDDRSSDRRDDRENRDDREGKRADCDTYARIAVVQTEANVHFRCNFRGPEWDREYDDHFKYCGHVRRETVGRELASRAVALQKCFDGLGDFDDDKWDRR